MSQPPTTSPLAQALELYQQGNYPQCNRVLGAALKLEPGNPQLWHLAGASARALGQLAGAEQCWRRAITVAPAYAEAHHSLGLLLQESGRLEDAVAAYRDALRHAPRHARALNNLGSALLKLDRTEEARQCCEQAVAIDTDYAKAHHNLGLAYAQLGRLEDARRAFETAIDLTPPLQRAPYYQSLTAYNKLARGDAALAGMESLAANMAALAPGEQMHLHFALGKAYGDLGEPQRSFGHFLEANRRKRAQIQYDEAATLARLRHVAQTYPASLIAARQGEGYATPVPVFIVGMPRSGSTLVEQILASHPQVHGAGECDEFTRLVNAAGLGEGALPSPEQLRQLGEHYAARLRQRAPQAGRIVDKTLRNFTWLGLIHLALPGAKIIHAVRDPVDTCLSAYSHLFDGDHPYAYDLAELGRYWRAYDALMAHWRAVLPQDVLLELRYEDLVEDLEGQALRLLRHCGLEWNNACLDFHNTQRPVRTASLTQVREPIFRTSVQKWRAYGELLQPLLDALHHTAGTTT